MRSPTFGGDADGAVVMHAGRYAREAVLVAFEMIGGVDRLAAWAGQNPGEFYTKMFAKTITREVEHSAGGGIEELLATLDSGAHTSSQQDTQDADFEVVDE